MTAPPGLTCRSATSSDTNLQSPEGSRLRHARRGAGGRGGSGLAVTRWWVARAVSPCRRALGLVYDGRGYLDAELGRLLPYPLLLMRPHLGGGRLDIVDVRGPARALEEELVQVPGRVGRQHPAWHSADVPVGVQGALGNVDEGAGPG